MCDWNSHQIEVPYATRSLVYDCWKFVFLTKMVSYQAESIRLMSKPGANSLVWDYFGLEQGRNERPSDLGTAICKTCNKKVAAKS